MQNVQLVTAVHNRYMVAETTSGCTSDIYLTDGETTVKLEDCLIWDSGEFEDAEFYDIVAHCKANDNVGVEEYEGWSIVD